MPRIRREYYDVCGEYKEDKPLDEYHFVISTWLRSYKTQKVDIEGMIRRTYFDTYHPIVTKLLLANKTVLATLEGDRGYFLGWACGRPGELRYVYVKRPFRRNGIATDLLTRVVGSKPGVVLSKTITRGFYEALKKKGWTFREDVNVFDEARYEWDREAKRYKEKASGNNIT